MEKEAAEKALNLSQLLSMATKAKLMHTVTKTYSKHMGLDTFFDDFVKAIDAFNECVQGHNLLTQGERIKVTAPEVQFTIPSDGKIMDEVKDMFTQFRVLSAPVVGNVSHLVSLRDDVLNTFCQLAYRLDLKG